MEKQSILHTVSVCLCINYLGYPANKSHPSCDSLYCHLWPVWFYHSLPHYLRNGKIFYKKMHFIQYKMCFDFLHNFVWNICHSKIIKRDAVTTVHRSSRKMPIFLSDFNQTRIFSTYFEKSSIWNSIKSRPVEAELFHADRHNKGLQSLFAIMRTRLKSRSSLYIGVHPFVTTLINIRSTKPSHCYGNLS